MNVFLNKNFVVRFTTFLRPCSYFPGKLHFRYQLDGDDDGTVAVWTGVRTAQTAVWAYQSTVAKHLPHFTDLFFVVDSPAVHFVVIENTDDDVDFPLVPIYIFLEHCFWVMMIAFLSISISYLFTWSSEETMDCINSLFFFSDILDAITASASPTDRIASIGSSLLTLKLVCCTLHKSCHDWFSNQYSTELTTG